MQEYTFKIFFENAIEMVSITSLNREREAQPFKNHRHFASSYTTQWKQLCSNGYHALMCDGHHNP